MNREEKIKIFNDVFAPKSGEKVLFLVDTPHGDLKDNAAWKDRRKMAEEWYEIFKDMGDKEGFSVRFKEYKATGQQNSPIPQEIINTAKQVDLVIAMTEYFASSTFAPLFRSEDSTTRGASMPTVEKRMEETAFKADYTKVQEYAKSIEKLLNNSVGAKVSFNTGDKLFIDLRNRVAESEGGDCSKKGQFINFPSGEACKAPYEGVSDEKNEFGDSKTEGILPVGYDEEIVKFVIKNNTIVEIIGESKKAEEMRKFFDENETRRNIAELGIGCNPNAVITGNILEDEKVGLHIAYGMSTHLGGKIKSDMHLDICYSKGCPVEGSTLVLVHKDGSKTELIKDAMLQYALLK